MKHAEYIYVIWPILATKCRIRANTEVWFAEQNMFAQTAAGQLLKKKIFADQKNCKSGFQIPLK